MEVSKNRENTIIFLTKCLLVVLGLFTTENCKRNYEAIKSLEK